MFRWLQKRKEKRHQRRQDKHRQILEALKAKDTTGSSSDYGFYKDDFIFCCHSTKTSTEKKPHDYEEIDEVTEFPQTISRLVGSDLRFDLNKEHNAQPPQLPARTFTVTPDRPTMRSASESEKRNAADIMNEESFRERAFSLPSFNTKTRRNFPGIEISEDEPDNFYHEPWDRKSNFNIKLEKSDEQGNLIHLRIYEKVSENTTGVNDSVSGSRLSLESRIYSEIEDNDTGCHSDVISQTDSDYSVFSENVEQSKGIEDVNNSFVSLRINMEEASDSDASSGFYEGPLEVEEEHKQFKLKKSHGNSQKKLLSCSFDSPMKFNTFPSYPRSPCTKIDEDSELYLIPKRRHSVKETKCEKLPLPTKKQRQPFHIRFGNNRLLDDLIWRNNFKQESEL